MLNLTPKKMKVAALTFTYNEHVNLPLWIRHYGRACGEENLFVADRGSTDGSVDNIRPVNLIRLPRESFDENEKTNFITNFFNALLNFYDAVIYTDCDEFLVPDPDIYEDLSSYAGAMSSDSARAVGIDVIHLIDRELSLDFDKTILSQRRYGKFSSPSCKALISRKPMSWLPGFHSCNQKIEIDPSLILFHLKYMDYTVSCARQLINSTTTWSEESIKSNYGAHHRWSMQTFVHHGFLVPMDIVNRDLCNPFEFSDEVRIFSEKTSFANGFWYIPMNIYKFVSLPERFKFKL